MPRSKYDPTVEPGDSRVRIFRCVAENRLNGPKELIFEEHEVTLTAQGKEKVTEPSTRGCLLRYEPNTASEEMLDLVHPDTGAVLGRISVAYGYAVLFSLGRLAQQRTDIEQAAAEAARLAQTPTP